MSQVAQTAIENTDTSLDVNSAAALIEERMDKQESAAEGVETPEAESDSEITSETDAEAEPDTEGDEAEDQEEGGDSEESEEVEAQDEPDDTEEETSYQSVEELAEALDLDVDAFNDQIKAKVKINGEVKEVSLAELRDGYQMESDYRKKTTEHAEQRRAFESEVEQAKSNLGQRFQEANALAETLESQLMQEFNGINWNELEQQDREEWLVQRQKYGEKYQQIQQTKQNIQAQLAQQSQEVEAKQLEEQQAQLAQEAEKLIEAIPEWQDNAVWEAEDKQMQTFLNDYGFTEAEVKAVGDHRLVKLVRDAMLGKDKTQKIDIAKKKVKKLPKIVKPGAKPNKAALKDKAKSDARTKLRNSGGKVDDVAAALMGRM